MDVFQTHAILAISAVLAGMMNAIAGGGTLLTFPALVGVLNRRFDNLDIASQWANATSTIALLPGSLASAWGYRKELQEGRALLAWLLIPSILGGAIGTLMVTRLPPAVFGAAVPWLVLTAAVLFAIQKPLMKWIRKDVPAETASTTVPEGNLFAHASLRLKIGVMFAQFLISIYGGYFGAGIGILMLTALSFLPLRDIHQMNALKTVFASVINGTSVILFIIDGKVEWLYVPTMVIAAIIGGYVGARVSRRLPASYVRIVIIVIAFGLAGFFFVQRMTASKPVTPIPPVVDSATIE